MTDVWPSGRHPLLDVKGTLNQPHLSSYPCFVSWTPPSQQTHARFMCHCHSLILETQMFTQVLSTTKSGLPPPPPNKSLVAYPMLRDSFLREVSTLLEWCDTPSWHLASQRHICAIPHFATYRAILVRYLIKIARKSFALLSLRKIRAPIKIKSALPPPPPQTRNTPPPKTRNFVDMTFSCRTDAFFQASIKLTHPFPAPELRTKFLQTRGFF